MEALQRLNGYGLEWISNSLWKLKIQSNPFALRAKLKYHESDGINGFNFSASLPGTPVPSNAVDLMADAKIQLNGHDRFAIRPQTLKIGFKSIGENPILVN